MSDIGGLRLQNELSQARVLARAQERLQALAPPVAGPQFADRLAQGLREVAGAQNEASELARNYDLGLENDLAKVMVSQQVSSLGFQLTLSLRNKALSAYKDIMNMPV